MNTLTVLRDQKGSVFAAGSQTTPTFRHHVPISDRSGRHTPRHAVDASPQVVNLSNLNILQASGPPGDPCAREKMDWTGIKRSKRLAEKTGGR